MLGVARRLARRWPGVSVRLVDRQSLISERTLAGFAALGWQATALTADVTQLLDTDLNVDIVCANLFLHHFEAATLQRMLEQLSQSAGFIAVCEPRRSNVALFGSSMVFAIGCNDVTRHDAVVSVKAGFTGKELTALWPDSRGLSGEWQIVESAAGLFTHAFTAQRRPKGAS